MQGCPDGSGSQKHEDLQDYAWPHPQAIPSLSGEYQPTQNHSRTPAKDPAERFSSFGHPSWLTSPGSSSASQSRAAIDGGTLDWVSMFRQATQKDAPCAAGYNDSLRVLPREQIDDTHSMPGMDDHTNLVPGRPVFSPESSRAKHSKESEGAVLQRFDFDQDHLKKPDPGSLNRVDPESYSEILRNVFNEKEKSAELESFKPPPKLRGILKPSRVYPEYREVEKTSGDSIGGRADVLPMETEKTHALESNRTALVKPSSGPSEPSKPTAKVPPHLTYSKSKAGEAQKDQKGIAKKKLKLPTKQKMQKQNTDVQTQPKLGKSKEKKAVKKIQKDAKQQGSFSEESFRKQPEVQEPVSENWPKINMPFFKNRHQLTLGMVEDYEGAPPRAFPHKCALCFVSIKSMTSWISHQGDDTHIMTRSRLQKKYPGWFPTPQTSSKNKKAKKKTAARSTEHRRQEKTKPDSRPHSNSDNLGGGSLYSHSRRSRSRSHSPGYRRGSKGKGCGSRSRSRSVSKVEGDRRSRSHENPKASVCPQSKYTPESAAVILQMFGLDKEDLEELGSYPEDQITSESMPLLLRQIFLRKKRSTAAAEEPLSAQTSSSTTAAVQESNLQVKQKLKKKATLKKIKKEPKARKASPKQSPTLERSPIKPPPVRVSSHLPTLAMIKDYSAATPRTFPHTCSLCNKLCFHISDWLSHQNTSFHLESCKILRTQFPHWDGDVLPILSAENRSPRSRSRSHSQLSRSRSRSNSYHRSESRERRRRSFSRSRSPCDRRYSQRSRSRSWSPRREGPFSPPCHSHSKSHERRSSFGRKEDQWISPRRISEQPYSPRRSHEKQTPQKLSQEKQTSQKLSQEKQMSQKLSYDKRTSQKLSHEKETSQKLSHEKETSQKLSHEKETSQKLSHEKETSQKLSHEKETSQKLSHKKETSQKLSHEKQTSQKLSHEKQMSQKLRHEKRQSKESSDPRSKKASTAPRKPPKTEGEVSRDKDEGNQTTDCYIVEKEYCTIYVDD